MAKLNHAFAGLVTFMLLGVIHSQITTDIAPLAAKGVNLGEPYSPVPAWYTDSNGLALTLCLPEVTGTVPCPPPAANYDPLLALEFPTNWPDETFYYLAAASGTLIGHGYLCYRRS